jgi:hypothetical protein
MDVCFDVILRPPRAQVQEGTPVIKGSVEGVESRSESRVTPRPPDAERYRPNLSTLRDRSWSWKTPFGFRPGTTKEQGSV